MVKQMLNMPEIIKILSKRVEADKYLGKISRIYATHRHLGRATGSIYQRQVNLVQKLSENISHESPHEVKILDWGCGKGQISYLLKKYNLNVVSCDLLAESEDSTFGQETPIINEKKIHVDKLKHEWKLPYPDEMFDIILSFGVLEHVCDDQMSLSEVNRVLKPGGYFLVFFLPNLFSWRQWLARLRGDWYHDRLYSIKGVIRLFDLKGFSVSNIWRGQLFPKNKIIDNAFVEKIDRILTFYSPFSLIATNIELISKKR